MKHTFLLLALIFPMIGTYGETITSELGEEEAWVGESVPFYITLKAPGPFSGSASFDLPELPRTFILKQGSPTVGNETIRGETWMTQRHEFRLFTQETGKVEIPSIRVRYEAKKDFVSKPEPHTGETQAAHFLSKRPPGTEGLSVVVTIADLRIEQSWSELPAGSIEAGSIMERTIIRSARDTTGMLFPEPDRSAPQGIRVYASAPEVSDQTERGASVSKRVDRIKYQFAEAGSFALPDLEFVWWNGEKLQRETLTGISVEVDAEESSAMKKQVHFRGWLIAIGGMILLGLTVSKVRKYRNNPLRRAVRAVHNACRKNAAPTAYAAVLEWALLSKSPTDGFPDEMINEWKKLSASIFSDAGGEWNGAAFCAAFRRLKSPSGSVTDARGLPALNPE